MSETISWFVCSHMLRVTLNFSQSIKLKGCIGSSPSKSKVWQNSMFCKTKKQWANSANQS